MKRTFSAMLAIALSSNVVLATTDSQYHLIGKSFNMTLDNSFSNINLQQDTTKQSETSNSVVLNGTAKQASLYLSISPVQVSAENTGPIDPQLVELVQTSYASFTDEIKKEFKNAKVSLDKIKAITLGGAPAQQLTFNCIFNGNFSKGIVIAAYNKPYLTLVIGTATAGNDKSALEGMTLVEHAIDTMALDASQRLTTNYKNEDFAISLPKGIDFISDASSDLSGFKYYRVVDIQGDSAFSSAKISVNSFAFSEQNVQDRQEQMSHALKKRLTFFLDQLRSENTHVKITKSALETIKVDGKPALRQPFNIINKGKKTEGTVIVVDGGEKLHLILAQVQSKGKMGDDRAFEQVNDSVGKIKF